MRNPTTWFQLGIIGDATQNANRVCDILIFRSIRIRSSWHCRSRRVRDRHVVRGDDDAVQQHLDGPLALRRAQDVVPAPVRVSRKFSEDTRIFAGDCVAWRKDTHADRVACISACDRESHAQFLSGKHGHGILLRVLHLVYRGNSVSTDYEVHDRELCVVAGRRLPGGLRKRREHFVAAAEPLEMQMRCRRATRTPDRPDRVSREDRVAQLDADGAGLEMALDRHAAVGVTHAHEIPGAHAASVSIRLTVVQGNNLSGSGRQHGDARVHCAECRDVDIDSLMAGIGFSERPHRTRVVLYSAACRVEINVVVDHPVGAVIAGQRPAQDQIGNLVESLATATVISYCVAVAVMAGVTAIAGVVGITDAILVSVRVFICALACWNTSTGGSRLVGTSTNGKRDQRASADSTQS